MDVLRRYGHSSKTCSSMRNPNDTLFDMIHTYYGGSYDYRNIVDWLPHHPEREYKERSLHSIRGIVLHHSASFAGTPQSFANYHINGHGWPGIGYHYVIDSTGVVYLTNFLTSVSYHCAGNNSKTIGICLLGNYMNEPQNEAQSNSLYHLISKLTKLLDIRFISPHRRFKATSCPGTMFDFSSLTAAFPSLIKLN